MKFKYLILGFVLASQPMLACGPEFQSMLLNNRENVLLQAPIGIFADIIKKWSKEFEGHKFGIVKSDKHTNQWGETNYDSQREAIESIYLAQEQIKRSSVTCLTIKAI